MHPGWKVFMQGWIVGFCIIPIFLAFIRHDFVAAVIFVLIWFVAYWCGAHNAERLRSDE